MNKTKSILVAVMMSLMFVAILSFMYLLKVWFAFNIIVGALATLGLVNSTTCMVHWLSDKDDHENDSITPIVIKRTANDAEVAEPEEDISYEAILREVSEEE